MAQRYAGFGDTMEPDVAAAAAIDASAVVPGAAGSVNLSHPGACQTLAAGLVGPDALPAEAFTREAADRLLALP